MICSNCNENVAVVFINKIEDGKNVTEGLCYKCAKEKGFNPLELLAKQANLSEENINDMSKQFEDLFNDISDNLDNQEIDPNSLNGNGMSIGSFISNMLGGNKNEQSSSSSNNQNNSKKVKFEKKSKNEKKKFIDVYGTNLTEKARNKELDIIVGRNREIQRVTQILNRRSKNNPCLIGEPGVGKTAIAQGLALKIEDGKVPAKLLNKEVYLLDMTAVIAGTQFRGQFESRMKAIMDECKTLGNIILVIDEIHNIIGAGDAEHSMNAANILKPALENGQIQLIGTTTLKEYRKYIEKDSAQERRFQPIIVEEPSVTDSIDILDITFGITVPFNCTLLGYFIEYLLSIIFKIHIFRISAFDSESTENKLQK